MNPPSNTPQASEPPLCVDLDGTLIATDLLFESLALLSHQHPLDLLKTPLWLLRGRHILKHEVTARAMPNPALLPYRQEVLAFLREQKELGRTVILVTAADRKAADGIADHLQLFDEVCGSDSSGNLKGPAKARMLVDRFGKGGFDYIGDSMADLPVWEESRELYIVAGGERVLDAARTIRQPKRIFLKQGGVLKQALRTMRPHQWVKNILIFLPLLLAHEVRDLHRIIAAALAFVAFSLCASAVYVINDLLDVHADRQHRSKRARPFAAGTLSLALGPPLAAALLIIAMTISITLLPWGMLAMLGGYVFISAAYSIALKRRLLIDVFCLAGLYTWRILSGGIAVQVPVTPWLLALSIFLFTSLAFAKRYTELRALRESDKTNMEGRNYRTSDLEIIASVGPTSGYLAVLVFSLYINGEQVKSLYPHPLLLWMICPVMLYWMTRLWFFAQRGALHDDPIVFAITDRVSWFCGAISAILAVLAAIGRH